MSAVPPLHVTAGLPGDDRKATERILNEAIRRAAEETGLTVIINYGTVVVQNQPDGASDTEIGGTVMNEKTDIHAVNSVVTYKSKLQDVQMMLNASHEKASEEEIAVREGLAQIAKMLQEADAKHAENVAYVSGRLEELSTQVAKPAAERKTGFLKLSAKGLKDAAEAVGDIVPGLLDAAGKVAAAIALWISPNGG